MNVHRHTPSMQEDSSFGCLIKRNIPLQDKNWFRTGGSARLYAEPTNDIEFQEALAYAQREHLPIFVLGQGANVLVSDEGFDGLVIRPALKTIIIEQHTQTAVFVRAGAGATIHELIEFCLENRILGLEEFSGIPGTVGGSVYINLHYFQFLLADFIKSATVLHKATGQIHTVSPAWFNFGYNTSTLQQEEFYLVDCTFTLKRGTDLDVAYARGRRTEIIRHRTARYPSINTCGSFFRNFHPEEVPYFIEGTEKKLIYVAYYLDKIGVKGTLRMGDAVVSHQHANMLVNKGNATSSDIIALAKKMQELVYASFSIIPQPECRFIGFKNYPLL